MSPKVKSWLLLGGIFVIGAVSGAALMFGLGAHYMRHPGDHDLKKDWMAHLTHELNLTTDQQAKIQPILTDAEAKLSALRHEQMRQGAQVFAAADDQISALLTPDQVVELKKMEAEREKMFGMHGHPPGGKFHDDGPENQPPPPPPPSNSAPPPPAPSN